MPKHEMAYYAIPPDARYDYVRVGHVLTDFAHHAPDGAVEITAEQAALIEADVTARSPKISGPASANPAATADLQLILAQLEALKNAVVSHAELHDQHQAKQTEHEKKFDEHARDISNVKVTTAKAISAALDGLGEKPA